MPLNLLQHKSWHVGSAKNQERVRRDERDAQLREEEEERRMQLEDADRRLQILRSRMNTNEDGGTGTSSTSIADTSTVGAVSRVGLGTTVGGSSTTGTSAATGSTLGGSSSAVVSRERTRGARTTSDTTAREVQLIGEDGHINLFPKGHEKGKRPTGDKKKEEEERELNESGMRLSRPAEPWYSKGKPGDSNDCNDNNDDKSLKKKRKEERRLGDMDPLREMKFGLEKLREVRRETEEAQRERDRDIGMMGFGLESRSWHTSHAGHRERSLRGGRDRDRDKERDRDKGRGKERDKEKDRERHKERHRHKEKYRERNNNREKDGGRERDRDGGAIEKLREEKRKREEQERRKAQALLLGDRQTQRR
ncbi:hypothetical protein TWF569_004109 [Orbilia oligospora]|uniref:CBF1-interacting co-repressor CIR N-terminal domain-containing protein n=1 Tax=Orbilia oligospora TaxID=2813651 RepID=A0A7C8N721_ORBOL|nr:hypothetical protein TWF102_010980 [Orbilia oligospora]KAF3098320.1 hypothetical protein TWF706_006763 [Orbilia oligospora]KAF3103894.1 hypothetical protein TWF103_007048 [Orbilia oligospora]KAF3157209.1 hypothetical protein TWF569_004109 [Orbilia oligospora]